MSRKKQNNGIAYQNKDIASKVFGESMRNRSLEVYGIHLPKIVDVLPTNLPAIIADELRIDQLFLLEDGSVAIIDYESAFRSKNLAKYMRYATRVTDRWLQAHKGLPRLHVIVIYTADVKRGSTKSDINLGCMQIQLEEGFLSDLNGDQLQDDIQKKLEQNIPLSEEDTMRLMVLPLTYRGKQRQQKATKEALDLAKRIPDQELSRAVLAGMLVFSNQIIERELKEEIYRRLRMTVIGQMFEEEKQRAIKKNTREVTKRITEREAKKAEEKLSSKTMQIAENFLRNGVSVEKVAACTGLSLEKVQELEAKLAQPV